MATPGCHLQISQTTLPKLVSSQVRTTQRTNSGLGTFKTGASGTFSRSTDIKIVDSCKYLGVYLNSTLKRITNLSGFRAEILWSAESAPGHLFFIVVASDIFYDVVC